MVANKDMEMPNGCISVTSRPFYSDELVYNYCPFYNTCDHAQFSEVNVKPNDCPLVEIVTCENCNNHGLDKEHHPDIDGARYCPTLHIYTGYDYYCGDAERRE